MSFQIIGPNTLSSLVLIHSLHLYTKLTQVQFLKRPTKVQVLNREFQLSFELLKFEFGASVAEGQKSMKARQGALIKVARHFWLDLMRVFVRLAKIKPLDDSSLAVNKVDRSLTLIERLQPFACSFAPILAPNLLEQNELASGSEKVESEKFQAADC